MGSEGCFGGYAGRYDCAVVDALGVGLAASPLQSFGHGWRVYPVLGLPSFTRSVGTLRVKVGESSNGREQAELVAGALALTSSDRTKVAEEFFLAHPGSGTGRFGLGRAVLDFQRWEVASGRLEAAGGSSWWRGVNGLMVLDMIAALRESQEASTSAQAWRVYADTGGPAQAALWDAHQRSLHAGLKACQNLLVEEPSAERSFAEIVVDVVDRTAVANRASDSDGLSRLTDRFYPKKYPVAPEALAGLRRMRERTKDGLHGPHGEVITNVGMDSTRWD
jgi:hypothetical protein